MASFERVQVVVESVDISKVWLRFWWGWELQKSDYERKNLAPRRVLAVRPALTLIDMVSALI
jgi:hypothetical protein